MLCLVVLVFFVFQKCCQKELVNVIMRINILKILLFLFCSLYKRSHQFLEKTNYTTCNQLAVLTILANSYLFRKTGKVFMTQCPIDDVFVETKMTRGSANVRNLKPTDASKLCLKREKPIFFNKQIYLIRVAFCQYLRCKFQFLRNLPLHL